MPNLSQTIVGLFLEIQVVVFIFSKYEIKCVKSQDNHWRHEICEKPTFGRPIFSNIIIFGLNRIQIIQVVVFIFSKYEIQDHYSPARPRYLWVHIIQVVVFIFSKYEIEDHYLPVGPRPNEQPYY